MSNYQDTKNQAARKTEDTKNYGQQKAGEAQDATKVRLPAGQHTELLNAVISSGVTVLIVWDVATVVANPSYGGFC